MRVVDILSNSSEAVRVGRVFFSRIPQDNVGVPVDHCDYLRRGAGDAARAATITSVRRRRQFLAGRRLLWDALARAYGDAAIRDWALVLADAGQPVLRGPGARTPAVTISHSGAYVACAIAEAGYLGLDIEVRRPRRWEDLTATVFDGTERETIDAMAEPARLLRCYELWTLKEAILKAWGRGLSISPCEIRFSADNRLQKLADGMPGPIAEWNTQVVSDADNLTWALAWTPRRD
jgi:phosphopantetheinyl transferase